MGKSHHLLSLDFLMFSRWERYGGRVYLSSSGTEEHADPAGGAVLPVVWTSGHTGQWTSWSRAWHSPAVYGQGVRAWDVGIAQKLRHILPPTGLTLWKGRDGRFSWVDCLQIRKIKVCEKDINKYVKDNRARDTGETVISNSTIQKCCSVRGCERDLENDWVRQVGWRKINVPAFIWRYQTTTTKQNKKLEIRVGTQLQSQYS